MFVKDFVLEGVPFLDLVRCSVFFVPSIGFSYMAFVGCWLLGLILKIKEDFVMRNKQVSGAGQTGLKRKQNDDRVLRCWLTIAG